MLNRNTFGREARRQFRTALFCRTLAHACDKVEGYRTSCGPHLHRLKSIDDLSVLPIVSKEEMSGHEDRFRDNSLRTAAVKHTGGSSGKKLYVHRSNEELTFIRDFYQTVIQQEMEEGGKEPSDAGQFEGEILCIALFNDLHGDRTDVPFPGRVFHLNLADAYWDLDALFSHPETIIGGEAGAIILSGHECELRRLTAQLIELEYDFARSRVIALFSTGDHVTPRLERWYQSIWKVPLTSRYALTETFGGARPCAICDHWHFEPHIIGEVVDVVNRHPLSGLGHGVLVVTCLYPFVQKQPLIRYWTGDVVSVGPQDCPVDQLAFRFAGRLAGCVFDKTGPIAKPLLLSARVYDILDEYPDVASSKPAQLCFGVADQTSLGALKFAIRSQEEDDKSVLTLSVETRYCSYHYPERRARLAGEWGEKVIAAHPHLEAQISRKRATFTVDLVDPGSLPGFFVAQIE